MRRLLFSLAAFLLFSGCPGQPSSPTISHDELVRRTQELADAADPGDTTPFKTYFADDAFYFDEKGRGMDKKGLNR